MSISSAFLGEIEIDPTKALEFGMIKVLLPYTLFCK